MTNSEVGGPALQLNEELEQPNINQNDIEEDGLIKIEQLDDIESQMRPLTIKPHLNNKSIEKKLQMQARVPMNLALDSGSVESNRIEVYDEELIH